MIHAWVGLPNTCNGASWSISCEWFAYLLFPIVAMALWKARRMLGRWPLGTLAASVGMAVGYYLVFEQGTGWMSRPVVAVTAEFIAGCLAYQVFERLRGWRGWGTASTVLVTCALLLPWVLPDTRISHLALAGAFVLIVFALACGQGLVARMLATRAGVFWGKASYSLYMVHGILHQILGKLIPVEPYAGGSIPMRMLVLGTYVVIVFGVAAATYLWFEQPLRTWIRGWPVAREPGRG
jgi:peptidoglycan/LPS O-acetylase OafA/YrhL